MADEVTDYLINQAKTAQRYAVGSLDDDPDKAARAVELSQDSGVPAPVIHADLESFERNHKAALTAQILRNSPHIANYVNSDPMAAKVSSDDWGALDSLSEKLQKLGTKTVAYGAVPFGLAYPEATQSVLSKALEAFKEGIGEPGSGILRHGETETEFAKQFPLAHAAVVAASSPFDWPNRIFKGIMDAIPAGVGEAYTQFGGNPAEGKRLARDVNIGLQTLMVVGGGAGHVAEMPKPEARRAVEARYVKEAQEVWDVAQPYIEAGIEPPTGLHPIIDKIKAEQAKFDLDHLKEMEKAAGDTATRERSPEMAANFIRQHDNVGEHKIAISADAIRAMYGDEVPSKGDGILGDLVPAEELASAESYGGKVEIPLADWLAKVDSKVANALHDHVQVRRGGLTLAEVKELGERETALKPMAQAEPVEGEAPKPATTPVEAVRKGSALEPMLQREAPLALKLKKVPSLSENYGSFAILDETGAARGVMELTLKEGGKDLHVEWIGGKIAPNAMGPRLIRGLLEQLKAMYPNAETISGVRVSGAREAAGGEAFRGTEVKISLADLLDETKLKGWDVIEPFIKEKIEGAQRYEFGQNVAAYIKPEKLYTENERRIIDAVDRLLNRVVSRLVNVQPASRLEMGDTYPRGIYQQYTDRLALILWSLESGVTEKLALGTARHEAIHHLRRTGFFTEAEWSVLEKASEEGNWIKNHDIDARYPGASRQLKLEESIAEEYKKWGEGLRPDHEAAKIFERIKELLEAIKNAIREVLGQEPTFEDLFRHVESGEIGERRGVTPIDEGAYFSPLAQEADIFQKASDVGMTVPQYKRYMKKVAERNVEDIKRQTNRAKRAVTQRQTDEWKENAGKVRAEVRDQVEGRPDISADTWLRDNGIKFDAKQLTSEQKVELPKEFVGKEGVAPDDLAGFFGYQTGEALVNRLRMLEQQRKSLRLTPEEYIKRAVDEGTEREMQKRFGNLEENILKEAQEHVVSDTQMDLLHEETLASGMKAGASLPFTKADFKKWAKTNFDNMKVGDISREKFLDAAGKAGRNTEMALLHDDPVDAFRQKQAQYMSMLYAQLAIKHEKALAAFERTAKQFSKREVPSVEPEYTNFIHDILMRVGRQVRRSVQDLNEAIALGEHKDLGSFVDYKARHDLREMPVSDILFDDAFRKPLEQLTADEFAEVKKSIDTLIKNGRDEQTIYKQGEAADLTKIKAEMIDKLALLGMVKKYPIDRPPNEKIQAIKTYWASSLTIESILNRWDRADPKGIFHQYIIFPLTEAANHNSAMLRSYQKELRTAVGKIPDIDKLVENSLWIDPIDGKPLVMRKRNVLGILQNVGNASSMEKLASGYGLKPQQVMDWLFQHTTKEDWDRAQRIGRVFDRLHREASRMAMNLSGVPMEKIDLQPIQTPFGTYDGWYNPVKYDPTRPGTSKKLLGPNALEEDNYFRATTPQGYTKARTGYIAPMELNLDIIPIRIKQMIHDITMRPAVIQANKIFHDVDFNKAVIKHYGEHYKDQLLPYLKDVANFANYNSQAEALGNRVIEHYRQNLLHTLIGFNLGTVLKHGPTAAINSMSQVGAGLWMKHFVSLVKTSEDSSKNNWQFAMSKSEELQRRMRNWTDMIELKPEITLEKQGLREFLQWAGSTPVAVSDLLSAVPTFLAGYEKAWRENGMNEGQAIAQANRAVRQAHGSSVITNRPMLMRTNALGATFASLYGFFSHMQQKQFELAWRAKDSFQGLKAGDLTAAKQHAGPLTVGLVSYIIMPALIEEWVTPYTNAEKDSWGLKALKTFGLGISSSFIGVRDIVNAIVNVRDPGAGMVPTFYKTITDVFRDIGKGPKVFNKEHAGKVIRDAFTVVGALTGLTNASEGKALQFLWEWNRGKEKPKGLWGWMTGLRHGKTEGHSQTFADWWKGKHK